MGTAFRPNNKVIIDYRFRGSVGLKNHQDGFRCTSIEAAKKAISKRVKSNIHSASFWDGEGKQYKLK